MKKKIILLCILSSFVLYSCIFSTDYLNSTEYNKSEPQTSAYSEVSVGLKWTVKIDGRNYASFNVTNITSTQVFADVYFNGKLDHNENIAVDFVVSDGTIMAYSMAFGTYNDTYGGRELTVCKYYVSTPSEYEVFDTATGVVVETNYSYYTLLLTSWSIYKSSQPTIPGYSWMILGVALIGTISYLIKIFSHKNDIV